MSTLGSIGSKDYEQQTKIQNVASEIPETSNTQTEEERLNIFRDAAVKFLSSQNEVDRIKGLKMLIAGIAKGLDVHEFAPFVVQLMLSPDLITRQLSYIYLDHYSDQCYETILLSINTFKKALADNNPIFRCLAIKMISSVPNPEIIPEIQSAIDQCIGDTNPYVKKSVAYAIIKAVELDPNLIDPFLPYIERLMLETDFIALSGAFAAYWSICPENIEFIHPNFRHIVNNVEKFDEYGQIYAMRSLAIYTRLCFKNPNDKKQVLNLAGDSFWEENNDGSNHDGITHDHLLIIMAAKKLLHSMNPAVVLSAVSYLYYCSSFHHLNCISRPLVRLLYNSNSGILLTALKTILSISQHHPLIFIPHLYHFYVRLNDSFEVRSLKLRILSALASPSNAELILAEITKYTGSNNSKFAALAVKSIEEMALIHQNIIPSVLITLLRLISRVSSSDTMVLSEIVSVMIKILRLKRGTADETKILRHLCQKFLVINDPNTRASVLNIVGDMYDTHKEFAPQLLRYVAQHIDEEPPEVKIQALNLAMKIFAYEKCNSEETENDSLSKKSPLLLPVYLIKLCERDSNFDIQDRARFLNALIETKNEVLQSNLSKFFFLSPKEKEMEEIEKLKKRTENNQEFQIGSFSFLFNRELAGYEPITEWAPESELPDSSVRLPKRIFADGTVIIDNDQSEHGEDFLNEYEYEEEEEELNEQIVNNNEVLEVEYEEDEEEEGYFD